MHEHGTQAHTPSASASSVYCLCVCVCVRARVAAARGIMYGYSCAADGCIAWEDAQSMTAIDAARLRGRVSRQAGGSWCRLCALATHRIIQPPGRHESAAAVIVDLVRERLDRAHFGKRAHCRQLRFSLVANSAARRAHGS